VEIAGSRGSKDNEGLQKYKESERLWVSVTKIEEFLEGDKS
jgi:hypothetical protein